MKKLITITKSPFPQDDNLPWVYSGTSFKNWVWEVLLDLGKAGNYPRNVKEAIEVAEGSGYTLEEKALIQRKYRFLIQRVVVSEAFIEVEADDEDSAEEKAKEEAEKNEGAGGFWDDETTSYDVIGIMMPDDTGILSSDQSNQDNG